MICAIVSAFLIKKLAYMEKKQFLCNRILNLEINIKQFKTYNYVRNWIKSKGYYRLGADSLDTVELIMEFEKEFGISIPDDKAEKIATVGDAISYIEENAK